MTEETAGNGDVTGGGQEPRECMPCRGSGSVISNLGGTPKSVTCPWCAGSGVRTPGIDAQSAWASRAPEAQRAPETAPQQVDPPDAAA